MKSTCIRDDNIDSTGHWIVEKTKETKLKATIEEEMKNTSIEKLRGY